MPDAGPPSPEGAVRPDFQAPPGPLAEAPQGPFEQAVAAWGKTHVSLPWPFGRRRRSWGDLGGRFVLNRAELWLVASPLFVFFWIALLLAFASSGVEDLEAMSELLWAPVAQGGIPGFVVFLASSPVGVGFAAWWSLRREAEGWGAAWFAALGFSPTWVREGSASGKPPAFWLILLLLLLRSALCFLTPQGRPLWFQALLARR